MNLKNFGDYDKAYLHREGVVHELDLVTLNLKDVTGTVSIPDDKPNVWLLL